MKTLRAFAVAIEEAFHGLGEHGFQVMPFLEEEGAFRMAGPEGSLVTVRLNGGPRRDRLSITGGYCDPAIQHGALAYKEKLPLITLSSSADADVVAREILTRLMPLVRDVVRRCADHASKLAAHRIGVLNTAEWVAEMAGGDLVRATNRDDRDALAISPRVLFKKGDGKREITLTVIRPGRVLFAPFEADENEAVNLLAELK